MLLVLTVICLGKNYFVPLRENTHAGLCRISSINAKLCEEEHTKRRSRMKKHLEFVNLEGAASAVAVFPSREAELICE